MTVYSVSIDPDAKKEIEKAINWYNYNTPGRGDKFHDQVYLKLESLTRNPSRHAISYRDVRRASLKIFPYYTLHYIVHEEDKLVQVRDLVDERRSSHHHPRRS